MNKQLLEKFKHGEVILYTPTFEDFKALMEWCKTIGIVWLNGDIPTIDEKSTFKIYNNDYDGIKAENRNGTIQISYVSCEKSITITKKDLEPDKQEFTKSDLKIGMVVECSNENKFIVANKTLYRIDIRESHNLVTWKEDLTDKANDDYNIIKVYVTNNLIQVLEGNYDSLQLIWERDAVDWYTIPVDTKILVRTDYCGNWLKRHFYGYVNNKVWFWEDGATSFSAGGNIYRATDAKLYKEDE